MDGMKVGVIGATGFVGVRLVRRLWKDLGPDQVGAFIHRSGNAWDLARSGHELPRLDIMSPDDLRQKLASYTHVVNCSRGDNLIMIEGLKNILAGCSEVGVKKLVHISSVAIYGRRFDGQTIAESHSTAAAKDNPYGAMKLEADNLVAAASAKGLPVTTLCPPNITGRNSKYLLDAVQAIRKGEFLRVDGFDQLPCETVDVENLVEAIVLALEKGPEDGRRVFVSDQSEATWEDFYRQLLPLADVAREAGTITKERTLAFLDERPRYSPKAAIRRMLAHDTRACLRQDPLLALFENGLRSVVRRLVKRKNSPKIPSRGNTVTSVPPAAAKRWLQDQIRNVRYSGDVAREQLGFQPPVSFDDSMSRFAEWYRKMFGQADDAWELLKHVS